MCVCDENFQCVLSNSWWSQFYSPSHRSTWFFIFFLYCKFYLAMSFTLFIYSLEHINQNCCCNRICWIQMDGWIQEWIMHLLISFTCLLFTSSAETEWEQIFFHVYLFHVLQQCYRNSKCWIKRNSFVFKGFPGQRE